MKNTRTGQRTIRKLLKGAGSAILLAALFVLVFAGTLSGAFGVENSLRENGIIESNVADAASTYTATLTSKTLTLKGNSSNINTYVDTLSASSGFGYTTNEYSKEGNSYTFKHGASYGYTNNSNKWGDEEYSAEIRVGFRLNASTSKFYKIRSVANVALWVEGGGSASVAAKAATAISNTTTAPVYDYPAAQNNKNSHTITKTESTSHGSHISVKGKHDAVFANTSSASTDANASITSANEITVRGGGTFYVFVKLYCWDDANTANISRAMFIDSISFNATETSPFAAGTGTSSDPYQLRNRSDFDLLSGYLRTDISFAGEYFKVQPDTSNGQNGYIDMLGNNANYGAYTPGGLYDSTSHGSFRGHLDGNNVEIRNLVISVGTDTARAALIGTAGDGAVISNVHIASGSSVSSLRSDAAGVVGFVSGNVTVSGCVNDASIYSPMQNGGIVANVSTSGNLTITNCQNNGTISGYKLCGGIVGYVQKTATVTGCVNNSSGKVHCSIDAGGIVGYAKPSTSITGCTNNGTVSADVPSYVPYSIVRYDAHVPNSEEGVRNMISDRNQESKYCTSKNGAMSFVIEVPDGVSIAKFAIRNANDTWNNSGRAPKEVYIWGSNTRTSLGDKTNKGDAYGLDPHGAGQDGWTSVYSNGNIGLGTTNYYRKEYSLPQTQHYKYYWIRIAGTDGAIQFSEFEVLSGKGNDIGGIVGYADGTSSSDNVVVDSSTNNGNVIGADNVGGIVGGGLYTSISTSATNSGKITGISAVGGIAGCAGSRDDSNKGFSIANAQNSGEIISSGGEYVGGISGYSRYTSYSGTISNTGNISASKTEIVGGVVGYLYRGTLANATNGGKVVGKSHVGGVVGVIEWGQVNNATNSGEVRGTIDTSDDNKGGYNVGGIAGRLSRDSSASNPTCITGNLNNTGCVSGTDAVGGIIGRIESGGNATFDWNATVNITSSALGDDDGVKGRSYVGGAIGYLSAKVTVQGSIDISGNDVDSNGFDGYAIGGIVGYNAGTIKKKNTSDVIVCAVRVIARGSSTVGSIAYNGNTYSGSIIGGIVGFNAGTIEGATRTNRANGDALDVISTSRRDYLGGIAGVNLGTLKNCENTSTYVGILNTNKYGGKYVGGVVGYNTGSVEKCKSTSTVNGTNYVGGFIGYNGKSGLIVDGYTNTATVTGENYVGGIVGATVASLTIKNSTNSGNISGAYYVGGLAGACNDASLIVYDCSNTTDVTGSKKSIGGILGGTTGNSSLAIYDCYNSGAITNTGDLSNIGGIVGRAYTASTTAEAIYIHNCYNAGAISDTEGTVQNEVYGVGGIVGYLRADASGVAVVKYCYNKSSVSGKIFVGGIVGGGLNNQYLTIEYCYAIVDGNNAITSKNDTAGAILGGANGGQGQTVNFTVNNSWGFYTDESVLDSHNTGAGAFGAYLLNTTGKKVYPIVDNALDNDWTKIVSKGITSFYIESGIRVENKHYLALLKENKGENDKGENESVTKNIATPSNMDSLSITANSDGSTVFGDLRYSAATTTTARNIRVCSEKIVYKAPDTEYTGPDSEFNKQGKSTRYTWTIQGKRTGYIATFALADGNDVNVTANGYTFNCKITAVGVSPEKIFGQIAGETGVKIVPRKLTLDYKFLSESVLGNNVYRNADHGLEWITISRVLDYASFGNVITLNKQNAQGFSYSYQGELVLTATGTFSKDDVGQYSYTLTIESSNYTFEYPQGTDVAYKTWSFNITPFDLSGANVWFGVKYDSSDINYINNMVVTNNVLDYVNGIGYYPLNATAKQTPQALIYQNDNYKASNFVIYVRYSNGNYDVLDLSNEYTLSALAPAGGNHVSSQSVSATGVGNFANVVTKYYVVLDSDFGWTSSDNTESWGTAKNPFVISTQAQFMRLSQILNGDKAWNSINGDSKDVMIADTRSVARDRSYEGAHFVVTADIDLDETFMPIGNDVFVFKAKSFASAKMQDGNVVLAKISYDYSDSTRSYIGLFGNAEGTEFKNLYVKGKGVVQGRDYVGGLVGRLIDGSVNNCTFTSSQSVEGHDYVGGLIGYADNTKIVYDNTSSTNMSSGSKLVRATVKGHSYVGGIVGKWVVKSASQFNDSNAEGLYFSNTGNVTVSSVDDGSYVGGIAGQLDASQCSEKLDVLARINNGSASDNSPRFTVEGSNFVGVLYGSFMGAGIDKTTIKVLREDHIFATLKLNGSGYAVGGLVGYLTNANLKFEVNYTVNNKNVRFTLGNNSPSFFGGLVGFLGEGATISGKNTQSGFVTLTGSTAFGSGANKLGNFVGGFVGYVSSGAGRVNGDATIFADDLILVNERVGAIYATDFVGGLIGAFGKLEQNKIPSDLLNNGFSELYNNLRYGSRTASDNSNIISFKPYSANNEASVTGSDYVGGLFGSAASNVLIVLKNAQQDAIESMSTATFEVFNSGAIVGNNYVGGIAGYLGNGLHTLERIVNKGKIGSANAEYVGGLVGYLVSGDVFNSVSVYNGTTPNASSDMYVGKQNVGGLIGYMQGGSLTDSISTGFKFDGSNTSLTKGGVVGGVVNPRIEGSWTIYIATSPTETTTSVNKNGKFVIVDSSITNRVGVFNFVLAMAGICKETTYNDYTFKQGELLIGVNYPTDNVNQLAFYDASGRDSVMTSETSTLAQANGIVRIGVPMNGGESYSVCVHEVKFSNIARYYGPSSIEITQVDIEDARKNVNECASMTDDQIRNYLLNNADKLNAQRGYKAPSGADNRYYANVTNADYYTDGTIKRIVANIFFRGILVGSTETTVGQQVGHYEKDFGYGSSGNPITISTQEEWNDFAWSIYTGKQDYSGMYVKLLTSDVKITKQASHTGTNNATYNFKAAINNHAYDASNATGKTNATSNLGYNMAGNIAIGYGTMSRVTFSGNVEAGSKTPSFKGTFDGNGNYITIQYEESASRASVFPNAESATIENLTVKGYVKATGLSGGTNDTVRAMSDYHILSSKSGNSATANEGIYKINDGDKDSKCYSAYNSMSFVAEFVAPLSVSGFAITNGGDNATYPTRTAKKVKIWGSNKDRGTQRNNENAIGAEASTSDGWTPVYSSNDIGLGSGNGESKNVNFSNTSAYKYYWVYIEGNGGGVQLSEFGFLQGQGFDCAGFVGKPFGSLVFKNCKNEADVSALRNAAGIIGFNDQQGYIITLESCVNEGNITSLEGSYTIGGRSETYSYDDGWGNKAYSYGTGGIIGSVKGSLTIQSCRNTGRIVGGHNVGGIIGCSDGTEGNIAELIIDSCANSGFVLCNSGYWSADEGNRDSDGTSDYEGKKSYGIRLNIFGYAGGLVGRTGEYSILKMYASYNSGRVIGLSNMVGGMVGGVGYLYQPDAKTNYIVTGGKSVIAYCYNIGEVSAGGTFPKHTANLGYVGGLIGTERKNDGGDVVGGIAGIVGNIDILDCYNTGNITAYGITAYNRSWQLRAGGIVGQSEPLAGNAVNFKRCYNIGNVNSRHILNTMGAGIWDTATALRYGAGISGYCDDYNSSASRVGASDCYSIAYAVTLRVANQKSTITGYRDSGFSNWYSDQRNVNWLYSDGVANVGNADEKCVKTGDLCTNYRDLTALMKSDASVNVPGTGWKTGNAYNDFNGTDTSFNLTASYLSIDADLPNMNIEDYPSGWIFVYGCLPQLAVFAVDTYNGLSMRSVNYGRNVYGEYQVGAAGTEFSPYVIKDGIDLLGLQTLVDLGYDFDGKYIEFANGTNNLEESVSKTINMNSESSNTSSFAKSYKYTSDDSNYNGGKSYHLFSFGAAQDYTNWKAENHAYSSGNTLSKGASFANQNFIPVGRYGANKVFKGIISGKQETGNTTLYNLRISYVSNAGLFANVQDAEVRNITVTGNVYSFSGADDNNSTAGGIVATAYGSTIIDGCQAGTSSWLNAYAYGKNKYYDENNIYAIKTAAGGIVGSVNTMRYDSGRYSFSEGTTATISNNISKYADVRSAKNNIGGIVGLATGKYTSEATAKGKNNKVEIVGNKVESAWIFALSASGCNLDDVATNVGGIIGYSDDYITILARECTVGVNNGGSRTVRIEGENRIGGIIGSTPAAVNEIIGCKVYETTTIARKSDWGAVTNAGDGGTAIGGIVGQTRSATGTDPITTTFSGNIQFYGTISIAVQTNYISENNRSNDGVVRNVGGIVGDMGSGARIATDSEIFVGGKIEITAAVDSKHVNRNIGGVAGRTNDVAFSGSFEVAPALSAETAYQIGGFIGKNNGTVNILADNTTIKIGGNITGSKDVGGFIGYNSATGRLVIGADQYRAVSYNSALDINILERIEQTKDVSAETLIDASGNNLGGIVGNNEAGGIVNIVKGNIVNGGSIGYRNKNGVIVGNVASDNVGGIIGVNNGALTMGGSRYENVKLSITNKGKVQGRNYVGGVIGKLNFGTIAGDFINSGNVKGHDYVGGSIGYVSKDAEIIAQTRETLFENVATGATSQSDALVAGGAYSSADDAAYNVDGNDYVGGSIGFMLGKSLGKGIDCKVVFRSSGTVNGNKYVGGSIGVLAGETMYTDFISEGSMEKVDATTAVGGSVGFIGVPNPLVISTDENERITSADIKVTHTHFEANGTLTLSGKNAASAKASAPDEYTWGGIGGAIGAIGDKADNLFDNSGNDKWSNNTYYASGNVDAKDFYHVGGIVGLIKADNITIANMLAYDTIVTGAKNVGGIVGATIGKKTVIDSAFSISTKIDGGVFTATEGNAGGIIGLSMTSDENASDDEKANDTDASTSYWVKGYSNAELAGSNVSRLQQTLGRYTLAYESWTGADGKTITVIFTEELIGKGATKQTPSDNPTNDGFEAIYPTPYYYIEAVGTHKAASGKTYTVNPDEATAENGYILLTLQSTLTWSDYFEGTSVKYVEEANAWVVEKENWTQYSTGTKQTGWYFVYANDQTEQESIGIVSAVHTQNINLDELYWKRIADAYTANERDLGLDDPDKNPIYSLIVKDTSKTGVVSGGQPEKGMLYATATSADFMTKASASGYYMYIASSGTVKPTAQHGTAADENKFFIRVEAGSKDKVAGNVAVYYRSIAMGSSIKYNGYERFAPISLQGDITYDTSVYNGDERDEKNRYYYNTQNKAGATPKEAGTYYSTVNVYYFDDNGKAYVVGGIFEGAWRISRRDLTFSASGMNSSYIYGQTAEIKTTLTLSNVANPDADTFDFVVRITDEKDRVLANITWDGNGAPNAKISDNTAKIAVSGATWIDGETVAADKKYNVEGESVVKNTRTAMFSVTYKMAKTYKIKVLSISDAKNYLMPNDDYQLVVQRKNLTVALSPASAQFNYAKHNATWTIDGVIAEDNFASVLSQFIPEVHVVLGSYNTPFVEKWNNVSEALKIEDGNGKVVAQFEIAGNTIKLTQVESVGEYYIEFAAPSDDCNYKFNNNETSSYKAPSYHIGLNSITVTWSTDDSSGKHIYNASTKGKIIAKVSAVYPIENFDVFVSTYFNQYVNGKKLDATAKKTVNVSNGIATIVFETTSYNAGKYSAGLEYSAAIPKTDCVYKVVNATSVSGDRSTKNYEIERATLYVSFNIADGQRYVYNTKRQGLTEVYVNGILSKDKVYIKVSGDVRGSGAVDGSKFAISLTDDNIDAKDYTATVELDESLGAGKNYLFSGKTTTKSISWTITPKDLTISNLNGGTVDYDATPHYPEIDISGADKGDRIGVFKYGDDTIVVNYSISGTTSGVFINVGEYTIKVADSNTITATRNGKAVPSSNYNVLNNANNEVKFIINPATVTITWEDYNKVGPFVYTKADKGLAIKSLTFLANGNTHTSNVSNGSFAGYGTDKLLVSITGYQKDAGSKYNMSYDSHDLVKGTTNSNITPISKNYVFSNGLTSGDFAINKSKLKIERPSGRISKVYDATQIVPDEQLKNIGYTISSTNGGEYRSISKDAFNISAKYNDKNVASGIAITFTYSLKSTYDKNYAYATSTEDANIGTITPATITVTLDKLRNGRATRAFGENSGGINVFYGGAKGAVNGVNNNKSNTYRLGEGFTISGFPSAETTGVVKVLAKYVEVGKERGDTFNGYVNFVYNNGTDFVKGRATDARVLQDNLFKSLVFSIEDYVENSNASANYNFQVVDAEKNSFTGNTLGDNNNPITIYDKADQNPNHMNNASSTPLTIEITVKTYKISYDGETTSQSYAKADGSYNTDWKDVRAVGVPDDISVEVTNGWRWEADGKTPKKYTTYTVIQGRAGSKELSAKVSGVNGKHLNYNMTNQPVLTIGYFVENSGDEFEIGSLSSLLIASYYWWVSANSGDPKFNQVINTTVTWKALISDAEYSSDNPPAFAVPSGAPVPPEDVTTWDKYFEWLETDDGGKHIVFLNETGDVGEKGTWGYYTVTNSGEAKSYSVFRQIKDINGTFTDADILMLDNFFQVYNIETDKLQKKEWGYGGEFIENFVKVGSGNVAVALGSIFKSLDNGFTGTYDGGGYVIEYFNIMSFESGANVGMFDVIGGTAIVKNLHLRNFTITATTGNVGGIAGKAIVGENAIENVSWHGTISMSGDGNVGGLLGWSSRSVTKAIALGTINAKGGNIGGLIGSIEKDATSQENVKVSNAVSFVYVDATGSVSATFASATGVNVSGVFYLASSAWKRNGSAFTSSDGTYGTAKTYTQLIDGESAEGVVKAGSLSGYTAIDGKKYYQGSQKGVYDMLDDVNLSDIANRATLNARQSMRLKDIIDVYVLMYDVKVVEVKMGTSVDDTAQVYEISASSWLVGSKHGTDTDAIAITNKQQISLLRELRFATFELGADVVAPATSGSDYAYGGVFFGKVTVADGKSYKIDFGGKRAFEYSLNAIPTKTNA